MRTGARKFVVRGIVAAGVAIGVMGSGTWSRASAAESPTEVARYLLGRYAPAIVSVNLVVKFSVTVGERTAPPRETKHEALATLIRPDGLAIVSLAAIDPSEIIEGARIRTPAGRAQVELSGVEFKLVRLKLADGTEVPARVVLKDADLDIAFVKPITPPAASQPFVDLTNGATPQVLSTGYLVARAVRSLQGAPLIRRVDIISISEKPRRRIVPENGQPGCPMFSATGKLFGICVRQFANGRPAGLLLLPPEDIVDAATQAAAMKAEPEATEAPVEKESAAGAETPAVEQGK